MPIPGTFEKQLGQVQDVAAGIVGQLVTLRFAGASDKNRLRDQLWERLQDYAALVQALAADQ
jgi:hypothetical protein